MFAEIGAGGSLTDKLFRSEERRFSTQFQFTELAGVGYDFDDAGRDEVSVHIQHFSNGGIKEPNPDETFVRLRFAHKF